MRYLVFDWETTGVGQDARNGRKPYDASLMPLPRTNYPVEVSALLLEEDGTTECGRFHALVRGAQRLDPWVREHCPHLDVKACDRDGVSFAEVLDGLAALVSESAATTLVAHNLRYDWDTVLVQTSRELNLYDAPSFRALRACPHLDTMVNPYTKRVPVRGKAVYYWSKIDAWIGPKLGDLCTHFGVDYDPSAAHDATYDTRVTAQCLAHLLPCLLLPHSQCLESKQARTSTVR